MQTIEDLGARQDGSPEATAAAAGGNGILGLINQPSASIRQASVPASGRQLSMAPLERVPFKPSNDISHTLPRSSRNDSRELTKPSDEDSQSPLLYKETGPHRSSRVMIYSDHSQITYKALYKKTNHHLTATSNKAALTKVKSQRWQRYPDLQVDRPIHTVR